MFEGVADQFHQFIASRTAALPLPSLSFPPLHGSSNTTNFPGFYPYTATTAATSEAPLQPNFLHSLHQGSPTNKNDGKQENNLMAMNLRFERERSVPELVSPWSNDEVLPLLRIRSSMDTWFPEFTWEHASSRNLAEVGCKRSAEKWKEKFEEDSRYFHGNIDYNKNYRSSFCEFEEIYHGDQNPDQEEATAGEKEICRPSEDEEQDKMGQNLEEDQTRIDQTAGNQSVENNDGNLEQFEKSKSKKRKRERKFEMFKGICEDIVNKMMAQQEEKHSKLLEDMVRRDKEKFAREEAWKKLEMDRIDKELELKAHEQALAGDRLDTLIKFMKKITPGDSSAEILGEIGAPDLVEAPKCSSASDSSSLLLAQTPINPASQTSTSESQLETPTSSTITLDHQKPISMPAKTNPSCKENQAPQNPSSTLAPDIPQARQRLHRH
ncbi:hypothetical protein SADUNF_Sadunf05G0030300 [Salix dunnii]|uniref:Myb-like domain-containing protein n=1 Tax=Salix dunnii TaxID=1413687 RepID=A0A835KB75_9ROSI|nr:hypothetical protein SADUNF_Sadunf05G0030300 [Salix dunnii]